MPSGLSKETTQVLKLHCTTSLGRGDLSLVAGSLPKDVLQALPDATLPLHSFLIWLPIRALLIHRGNCRHCLQRDRKERLRMAAYSVIPSTLVTGLRPRVLLMFVFQRIP